MPALAIVDTRRVYDWLFSIYVPIGLGVFALFSVAIVVVVVVYRVRPPTPPSRRHEANAVEIGFAAVLVCVTAFLLYFTFHAEHKVDVVTAQERPAVTIDVTGSRWEWIYRYPAYGITRRSGAEGDQSLVVPTNVPVRFRLTSADVLHSFWLPALRFKREAIPGTVQVITLDFDHGGTFSGACAEYCGLLHAEMVFTVDALSPSAFHAWAAKAGARP